MTASKPYDLQRLYTEKAGGPFEFTWADQTWTLPNPRMLDITVIEKVDGLSPADASVDTINALFDDIMGAEQGARWREVPRPLPMLMDLLKAWMEHSQQAMGESEASASSSKSTGRPSKRTSNGSTASASRGRSSAKPRKSATAPARSSSASAT